MSAKNETVIEYRVECRRKAKEEDEPGIFVWRAWRSNRVATMGSAQAEYSLARALDPTLEFRLVTRTVTRTDWTPL